MTSEPLQDWEIENMLEGWRVRHSACGWKVLLVKVWVILDRPPNDPLLRKKDPSPALSPSRGEAGESRRPVLLASKVPGSQLKGIHCRCVSTVRPWKRRL